MFRTRCNSMTPRLLRARLLMQSLEARLAPATFTVMNLNDGGAGSLRDCIAQANAAPGADTIDFQAGISGTITLGGTELSVSDDVAIVGPGSSVLTVSGNKMSRIFDAGAAPAMSQISLCGMTLTGGKATGNDGGALAGGQASITLSRCVLTGNVAEQGGAVSSQGSLTATECSFLNNSATDSIGAISVYGPNTKTILSRCTISGNSAYLDCGGILVSHYLLLDSSTVSDNTSGQPDFGGYAGGIDLRGPFAADSLTIRNSTISGNLATHDGAGIFVGFQPIGTLVVQNSTIIGNKSAGQDGGGIYMDPGSSIALESSIVQYNTAVTGNDISSGSPVSALNCAIGSISGIATFTDLGGNLIGSANLKLGPLADNGGPTKTHALLPGSSAIDAGSNPAALSSDPRGVGFVRTSGAKTDIGAFETQNNFIVLNANDQGDGSLRQAILNANANPGADTVTFDPNFFSTPQTITAVTDTLPHITEDVSFQGTSAENVTVTRGGLVQNIFISTIPGIGNISFSNMTITGGQAQNGSAIYAQDDNVNISGCTLSNNVTNPLNGSGGAIFAQGGLVAGVITVVTVTDSTISGNTAFRGGGIYLDNNVKLVMNNSTVSDNQSTGLYGGGGIHCNYSSAIIRNSTITGNSASNGRGGGIELINAAAVTVQNSTVANNIAAFAGGGIDVNGAALPCTLVIESTIVAKNFASGAGRDIYGGVTANYSLIGVRNDGPAFTPASANDKTGTVASPLDAKLGPLANNGGPTLTAR